VQARCTISLVLAGDVRMVVDTGGPDERNLVVELLAGQDLAPDDIEWVVCTHGHLDHVGNLNLFPYATFLSGQDRSIGDHFSTLDLTAGPIQLTSGVEVIATPGHTSEDISVLVHTDDGVVAIAGDVFENGDMRDQAWLQFSRSPRTQRRSRSALLAHADFIVPGHGPMFGAADYRRAR
jgi:glyoxylase-like metal-dependent hydrolase (beta-lactamase superfamily II)